ncbi:MAG TPA: DUF4231 domain-containing protein [Gaiellaceae bacterium]|nr:DUF4231 domain-containing protein [Gaiellaceae bacterium]
MAAETPEPRTAIALRRCNEQIAWYERHSKREWVLFVAFQSTAVLLAALTPVLILWAAVPKAVQALPAALASVAAGLVGTFRWLQNKTRFAYAAEALKSERVLFATRTPPRYGPELPDDAALAAFVARIEEITMNEVSEWRVELTRAASSESPKAGS